LLASYKIDVIGTFPGTDKPDELFFELKDEKNQVLAAIAAIPFLQDRFVRQVGEGEGAAEISQKIKQGIKTIFKEIGKSMQERYPNVPRIGMAHLHAQGMHISEAERDIQIGNQDGVAANDLDQFDFLGLGHIHTGQSVIPGRIEYASSPISLCFTENNYQHKIIQLEIIENKINQTSIPIPKFRSLYQIKGTMDEVEAKLFAIQNKYALPVLLDLFIEEAHFDPTISGRIDILKNWCTEQGNIKIVSCRVRYQERVHDKIKTGFSELQCHELDPHNLFVKMIEDRPDENQKQQLLELFNEIVADATQIKE
jgi:exonuclease SbcD